MARIVFDTSVLLAIALDEQKAGDVEDELEAVSRGENLGLISAAAVVEIFEKITRVGGREVAVRFLEKLKSSGLFVVDVTEEIAKLAGPLKARFPQLSTADAIIISTAYANKAKLYTFDKGFFGIGGVDLIGINEG